MIRIHRILFYTLLVFLPLQIGYHFWPAWTIVLGRRVDYLSPILYGTDIMVFLLLVSWFVSERKTLTLKYLRRYIRIIPHPVFLVGIILFAAVNIALAASPAVALYKWFKVSEFGLLAWYVVQTKPKFSSVIFFVSIGVLYSSVIATAQFIVQHSIGGVFWWLGERTFSNLTPGIAQVNVCKPFSLVCTLMLRAYGTFPHPNVLGGYLAITLPLIMNFPDSRIRQILPIDIRKHIFSFIRWFTIFVGAIALILTFSRGAWAMGALGIIGSYFIRREKQLSLLRLVIICIPVIFITATMISTREESVVVRNELNIAAVQIFSKSPLIGNGLGNYLVKLPENLVSRQIYFLQPVHNIYLLILAETGIIGLGIFIWLLWKAFTKLSVNRRRNLREHQTIKISLIALVLLGLVDHYLLTLQQGQLLFTLILAFSFI